MRFAKSRIVNYSPSSQGRWNNLSNGDRIWKLGIHCANSYSVSLLFSEFKIPVGARVYIYSENQSQHLGPFTKSDNRQDGEILVTPPIYGNKLIIEYYEPFAYRGQGDFFIKSVQHGYRDLRDLSGAGDCLSILESSPNTAPISSSVLMMIVDGGQKIATGTLVNNSLSNSKPYLLTSLHAMKGKSDGWVFLFDVTERECIQMNNCWSSAVCGASPISIDSINGTALLTLRNAPPRNWSVYYSGWNTSTNENAIGYKSIQHANGFVQSLSVFSGQLQSVVWNGFQSKKIYGWASGGTSYASIGSPLFDASNNLVGIYVGGDLSCDGAGDDYFAEFAASYPTYNAFLDPVQSGVHSLEGVYSSPIPKMTSDSYDVFFFPNPAKTWINTQVTNESIISEIQIYDAQGKLSKILVPQTSSVYLDNLPEGLYFIHFISGENRSIQKLLIR